MTTEANKWLEYPSVKKFEKLLKRGRITESTLESYLKCIHEFCTHLGFSDPETALKEIEDEEDRETYFDDLIGTLREKGVSDTRITNIYKAVKWWLNLNKIDVDWREIILPSVETVVEDRAPTKEELAKILNVAKLRDKALILVACSCGLRRNTLRTLKVGDVNFEYPDIARIMVKKQYEVNGKTFTSGRKITRKRSFYVSFITPEAKGMLQQYLESRKKLGENITEDSPLFSSTRHKELGSFMSNAYLDVQWIRLLKRAGLDKKSHDWYVLHFHTLKKYAQTQFINAGCKPSYREFWLGHRGSYLETSYFRGEESSHIEEYRKAIPYLTVTQAIEMLSPERIKEAMRKVMAEEGIGFDVAIEETAKQLGTSRQRIIENILKHADMEEKGEHKGLRNIMKVPKEKPKSSDCQRIVSEKELEKCLAEGYKYIATLPSGKILVSNEE